MSRSTLSLAKEGNNSLDIAFLADGSTTGMEATCLFKDLRSAAGAVELEVKATFVSES